MQSAGHPQSCAAKYTRSDAALAHGRGGARSEEGAVAKGRKPVKLPDLRRKLPAPPVAPPVAPRELPGVPPGLRWASGEAAVKDDPAGLDSGDADGWPRLRKPAAGAHAAGTSRFFCIGECIESCE